MLGGISRITPACAGSTVKYLHTEAIPQDHPRLRGEYAKSKYKKIAQKGSPPLARGVQIMRFKSSIVPRITPACAGSTSILELRRQYDKDHPRLRGEYFIFFLLSRKSIGSPPLARGVPCHRPGDRRQQRITPACAGSTLTIATMSTRQRDHPRLRGEYTKKSLILRDPCLLV